MGGELRCDHFGIPAARARPECALSPRAPPFPRRSAHPREIRRPGADRLGRSLGPAGPRRCRFPNGEEARRRGGIGSRPIVVANGAEGEPASAKDRRLLEWSPHLVLDGALLAAQAVGADEIVLCVRRSGTGALESAASAVAERDAAEMLPVPVQSGRHAERLPRGRGKRTRAVSERGPPKPTFVPPRPFERGVAKRPTLVQNLETFAHLALIARYGAEWFREAGTTNEPGPRSSRSRARSPSPGSTRSGSARRSATFSRRGRRNSARPGRASRGLLGSWLNVGVARDLSSTRSTCGRSAAASARG